MARAQTERGHCGPASVAETRPILGLINGSGYDPLPSDSRFADLLCHMNLQP